MTKEELIPYIKEKIKNNTSGDITGNVLQKVLEEIVNQDYILIYPKDGRDARVDAALTAALCEAIDKKTIFDYIVNTSGYYKSRPLCYEQSPSGATSIYMSQGTAEYTLGGFVGAKGYHTLAKIQEQQDILKGGVMQSLPVLSISDDGLLYTKNTSGDATGNGVIVSPDGYAYEATAAGGPPKFRSVTKSTTTAEEAKSALSLDNVIVLSEEDAAALIGYIKS